MIHKQKFNLATYCQVVTFSLEKYDTDDFIPESDTEITIIRQSASLTTVSYSEVLCQKPLGWWQCVQKINVKEDSY